MGKTYRRRSFLAGLAALPFLGKLLPVPKTGEEPASAPEVELFAAGQRALDATVLEPGWRA